MMRGQRNTTSVIKKILVKSVCLPILFAGWAGSIANADEAKTKQNEAVAKSIENILQKASEQGFVDLKDQENPPQPKQIPELEASEIQIEQLSAEPQVKTSCENAEVLNLNEYRKIATYNDITVAKSKLQSVDSLDARIPLIKTYWSLGLGSEAQALIQSFNDPRTPVLTAVSNVLSGDVSEHSKSILKQLAPCSPRSGIWYKSAIAGASSRMPSETEVIPENSDLTILNEMPVELREILTRRLGIYAAETGNTQLAEKMLRFIEPDAKNGDLPQSRDDEIMYLFALVDASHNRKMGIEVLERLSKFDGPLRTRSIFHLSSKFNSGGKYPYPGFSDDLQSVSQQYNGKYESRKASLETIKIHLKNGSTIESIALTNRAFDADEPARVEIVASIADKILVGLDSDKNIERVGALDAYLFDIGFFDKFESKDELMHESLEAAIALGLPELEARIVDEEDVNGLDQSGLKLLVMAKTKAAQKSGNVIKVIKYASIYEGDAEFRRILVESLLSEGRLDDAIEVVKTMPSGSAQNALLADIEWQAGEFKSAHSHLLSVDVKPSEKRDNNRLQFAGLLTSAEATYSNMIVPESPEDLDEFQSDISKDIDIAKAYLTGG